MSLKSKAIHGAKWSMLQEIASQLIDFLIIIILARLLGPTDFGIVAMALVIVTAMRPLVSLGLGVAITQRAAIDQEHLNTAFWATLLFGALLTSFMLLTAKYWAVMFSEPRLAEILPWLSLSLVFVALTTVQEAILRRDLNFKVYAIRTVGGKIFGGVVGVTLALTDFGIWSLVARNLVTAFISMLLLWGISNWRPSFKFDVQRFKVLFTFGLPVTLNELLAFVKINSDSLLISYFLGATALGYYNIAYRLMAIVFQLVTKTISQVGMPAFSRLQDDPARLASAFISITQLIAAIAFPAFLGIAVLAPELVPALFGEQWLASIPVLRILMLIGIAHCLLTPMLALLVGVGKPKVRLKLQAIDSIANLIGFSIAVHWGIVGVAVSYVIVGCAMFPLWYLATNKAVHIDTRSYFKAIFGPMLLGIIMVLAILYVKTLTEDQFANLGFIFMAIPMGAILYLTMAYWALPDVSKKAKSIVMTLLRAK